MGRASRDERLNSREARQKLSPRAEPYWRNIQDGRALGYRRAAGGKAGSWVARHYAPETGRRYRALGAADDLLTADGNATLSFPQAQKMARDWFAEIERNGGRVVESITVVQAMAAYLEVYKAKGGKALRDTERTIEAHVLPALGSKQVESLTHAMIRSWRDALANAPARVRSKAGAVQPAVRARAIAPSEKRARQATANRILTVLKAALNLAFQEGRAPYDEAWRRVKPFAKADAPKIRYLVDDESRRLTNGCPPDFRSLITAALLTGCRYGELTALRAGDFDAAACVLHIRVTKNGKGRAVPLTDEAVQFFSQAAAGKGTDADLLVREGGSRWNKSEQFRPLRAACEAAQITPAVSFHILRHTFASRLAMRGVPMSVVAAALGNSEAICAKHYAHLAPSWVADTIRANAGGLGIVAETNVVALTQNG